MVMSGFWIVLHTIKAKVNLVACTAEPTHETQSMTSLPQVWSFGLWTSTCGVRAHRRKGRSNDRWNA